METELDNMENVHACGSEIQNNSCSGSIGGDIDIDGDLRYTSLKDIIPDSPSTPMSLNSDGNFDSSNISIRNQLVKQAASAYLQSAMILGSPNQSWVGRVRRKIHNKAACFSLWRIYVANPIRACFWQIFQIVGHLVFQIGGVWCSNSRSSIA
ncbi:uncharacterized protein LOC113285594 [Papaver somniferum]|uniref:uncharacterized protein LOC113285594 n=1 Tax=Papaver somniferum TaxID=3469 RepID=UPI000E701A63|nr:uncharacterized protein LOC113285594 [Papaver somniferum]